jgi:hypothetical protein
MKYTDSKIGLGALLIFFAFIGDGFTYLPYWNSGELIGRNIVTVALVTTGIYLIYKGYTNKST